MPPIRTNHNLYDDDAAAADDDDADYYYYYHYYYCYLSWLSGGGRGGDRSISSPSLIRLWVVVSPLRLKEHRRSLGAPEMCHWKTTISGALLHDQLTVAAVTRARTFCTHGSPESLKPPRRGNNATPDSGGSKNFARRGGGRQFISSVLIYRLCAQRNICLYTGKTAFWKKYEPIGKAAPPSPFESATAIREQRIQTKSKYT